MHIGYIVVPNLQCIGSDSELLKENFVLQTLNFQEFKNYS